MATKVKSKATNHTNKKIKSAPVAVNPNANPPNKTQRSKGFFYVSEKPKGSGKWRVMFESWKDGKKKQTQISPAMFAELGLTPTMTVFQQAKELLRKIHVWLANQNHVQQTKHVRS